MACTFGAEFVIYLMVFVFFFPKDELISHGVPDFIPNQVVLYLKILFNLHLDALYFSP